MTDHGDLACLADGDDYPAKAAFGPIADKAEADGCQIHRFDSGHDIMLEAPREFVDVLLTTTT
jgi:hypothetical protein